jgi:hypothetical protein
MKTKKISHVEATLNAIDFDQFWARVLKRVAPLIKANEEVRRRSLEKAGSTVLD